MRGTISGGEVAVWIEGLGVFEMGGVIVGGPGILGMLGFGGLCGDCKRGTHHEKSSASWNDRILPLNIFDALTREADGDDRPEAQGFFDESRDIGDIFFCKAFLPSVTIGIGFHDFGEGVLLNFLAVW